MSYNGTTEVASGLKQMGTGNYKLVNAQDVYYSDEKSAKQAIDEKLGSQEAAGQYIPKPAASPDGQEGQLLKTNGDGTTEWTDQGTPTSAQVGEAVSTWLTNHPEATTTVQDGSITEEKLASALAAKVDKIAENTQKVADLKSAVNNFNPHIFPDYYPQSWINGYYINANTGAQATASSWSFSNYFNVIPGSKLRIVNFAETVASPVGVAFYDAQAAGAYISGSGFVYDSAEYAEITVPSNAKYCRISVLTKKLTDYGFSQEIEPWIEEIESKADTAFDKSDIISHGKNLFDKNAITPQRYLSANGNPTYNANYCVSDFIPLEEGKTYQLSNAFGAGWVYDANKSPLHINAVENVFTAQSGEEYLRISVANANIDIAQVEESLYQSKFQSYGYKIKQNDLDFDEVSAVPDNFFNPNVLKKGYMNSTTGNVSATSADLWVTGFIGIETGKIYTISGMWGELCLYDADGTFSRSVEGVGEEFRVTTFQPVDDESYARFTVRGSNKTKCKFEENIGYSKHTGAVSGVVNVDSLVGETEKITHVYVGSPCFFKTINSANSAISGNSKYNRFVIHIFEGTYNETFRTKDWVDYVGDNKHQCIIDYISDDESDYVNRSTIFAETNSRIANLTIKTTGSKYPIHADANYGLPYVVTIEDCIVKHDGYADTSIAPGGTGIGIGLHYDQRVVIRRCVIAGTSNVFGVASVYCHNDNQNQNNWWARRERSLTIEDCILQDSYYGVRLDAIETVDGQDNDFIYIGNVNTCQRPFLYNPGSFDSWHYFGLRNDPEYTPSN